MSESRGSTTWVQPIVVDKTADHWSTVICAAAASALVRYVYPDLPAWAAWDGESVAKTVRRADRRNFDKALAELDGYAEVRLNAARALALPPLAADALPRAVARMQVTGTELVVDPSVRTAGNLFLVILNADLGMSTGKASAQAAHAVHAVVTEHLSPEQTAWWAASPTNFTVLALSGDRFADVARRAPVRVNDAGHTEVEPGSLTAVALLNAEPGALAAGVLLTDHR